MKSRSVFFATNNAHKLSELNLLVKGAAGLLVRGAREVAPPIEWQEVGSSFVENAIIKAKALKAHTDAAVLADDSGLCVDALGGAPGIYSSRYAGETATDSQNIEKLLQSLKGVAPAKRSARFVCALAFIDEGGKLSTFEGHVEGRILEQIAGKSGFGYDPLFFFVPAGKSFAEMSEAAKNEVSHRAQAVKLWLKSL